MYVDDEFVKQYDDLIWERIQHAGFRDEMALEARAAIYVRILNSDNYDPEKGAVSTWIYMICRSVISNMKIKKPDALDCTVVTIDRIKNKIGKEDVDFNSLGPMVNQLLGKAGLSRRDKELIRDHHLNGYTILEAAEKHRMTYEAAKKAIVRALKQLREAAENLQEN